MIVEWTPVNHEEQDECYEEFEYEETDEEYDIEEEMER